MPGPDPTTHSVSWRRRLGIVVLCVAVGLWLVVIGVQAFTQHGAHRDQARAAQVIATGVVLWGLALVMANRMRRDRG